MGLKHNMYEDTVVSTVTGNGYNRTYWELK